MNFTLVLYQIDRIKTKTDDVYGETVSDGIKFLPPIEFNGYVQVLAPENKTIGTSKIEQLEPGNLKVVNGAISIVKDEKQGAELNKFIIDEINNSSYISRYRQTIIGIMDWIRVGLDGNVKPS